MDFSSRYFIPGVSVATVDGPRDLVDYAVRFVIQTVSDVPAVYFQHFGFDSFSDFGGDYVLCQ